MRIRIRHFVVRIGSAAIAAAGVLAAAVLWAKPAATVDKSKLPPPAAREVDFVKDVRPILSANCYSCHGEKKQKSDYRLDQKQSALHGGSIGGSILPGKSADSPFIHYVAGMDEDMKMPAKGDALSAEQVGILRKWIDQGAPWPDDVAVSGKPKSDHWAFRPLVKPSVPPIENRKSKVENPIDAFILSKLDSLGMKPSPQADRRTLIRRIYFDLIGLPPTPEDIAAFVNDRSADAYEKVVDRLLASERYGERWARHWMDVVHFAETHGNDQDRPREQAWPYRDYLIRSFNEDKPYARFIQEQIAADALFPENPAAIAALGFIASGPWDESSLQSIQDETLDKKIAQNLDRDDMLATTMATFASVTVHCARCHNHKFDPISQAEYYSLQSCFAGVDRANREYDADPAVFKKRLALQKQKADLAKADYVAALAGDVQAQAQATQWEKEQTERVVRWTVLSPAEIKASSGATPVRKEDGSILFTGNTPETETYTLTADVGAMNVTAVRIEVLADASLPHKGPGRQPDNGNLHLSEFKLLAANASGSGAATAVALHHPTADFNQDAWTITHVLDGNPQTAWGIHPQEGKSHSAVFELKTPLAPAASTKMTFVLEQLHGRKHVIGKLRISATDAKPPVEVGKLRDDIAAIVATPPEKRTAAQKSALAAYVMGLGLDRALEAMPKPKMVFAAAPDFPVDGSFRPAKGCRPIFVLRRGDVNQPIAPATPAGLSVIPDFDPAFKLANINSESERRAALAKWLSDSRNVLTWRSIANRIWHYHFGRGIVDSPNDLGKMGGVPSHPELLDYLALWLQENGGSLKGLHRLIVTSATYRQSSQHNVEYAKIDAGNAYLWRMNRSRLDAESIRDAVLQITGRLDTTMYGPSVRQFIQTPGIHITPVVDYQNFDVDSPAARRRSVYRFIFRTLPDPFMDSMDCPDASQLAPTRSVSVTALQALSMLNNHFMVRYSEHFASRAAEAGSALDKQIERAYELALGRKPTPKETTALSAYAAKYGMANVCRLILNGNEFMFVN